MSKKIIFTIIVAVLCVSALSAQTSSLSSVGEANPTLIGVDSAQQKLKEISISRFEDPGFWTSFMMIDQGVVTLRRFPGGPADKKPISGESASDVMEQDRYVLGAKVSFYRRGVNSFAVMPVRPLPIEGITKTISLWVVGRNYNHVLKIILSDYFGNRAEVVVGKLNFSGWKKMTVAIPSSIVQRDYHYTNLNGIKVVGFVVDCDPAETYGTYYIYFDDLRAETDLFAEESRDVDDMMDTW